jgi:hypothetical protein
MEDGSEHVLLEATILTGHARLDEGRLDEAETLLRGSIAAARSTADLALAASAGSALARCLFWRGHYGEADAALESARLPCDMASTWRRSVARRGRPRHRAGMAHASSAWDRAERHGRPVAIARAICAVAFAHLAAGDLRGVSDDVLLPSRPRATAHAARSRLNFSRVQPVAPGVGSAAERFVPLLARANA